MAAAASIMSFRDLNDYCKLDVFKYLDIDDRVCFERVHSEWKELLRGSTTHLDLTFLNDVGRDPICEETGIEPFMSLIRNLPKLQSLILPNFFPLDLLELAELCPNLLTFRKESHLMNFYELVEFCSALEGNARFESCLLFYPPGQDFANAAAKCPNLTELVIDYSLNTDEARPNIVIPKFPRRKPVHNFDWLDAIAHQIKKLTIRDIPRHDNVITKFKNLTELTIYGLRKKTALALVDISNNFKLRVFEINNISTDAMNPFEVDDAMRVTGLTSLTSVYRRNDWVNHFEVVSTLIANNLSSLDKVELGLRHSIPEVLGQCSKLTQLHIYFATHSTPENQMELWMEILTNSSGLRELVLVMANLVIKDEDLKAILEVCSKLRQFTLFVPDSVVNTTHLVALVLTFVDYSKQFPKRSIKFTMLFDDSVKKVIHRTKQIENLTVLQMSAAQFWALKRKNVKLVY